jgi:hypothetical protein
MLHSCTWLSCIRAFKTKYIYPAIIEQRRLHLTVIKEDRRMTHLRKSLILTAMYLAFVFSLGRFDFLGQGAIILHSYYYLLILAMFVSIAFVPYLRNVSLYVLVLSWLGVYFGIRTLFLQTDPLGGANLYLTLLESSMLTIGVLLTWDLDHQLNDYESALAEIGQPKVSQKVYVWDEAAEQVKTEFVRSRRYNHPISLMVIEPTRDSLKLQLSRSKRDTQRIMLDRFIHTSLARLAAGEARRTDLVIELESDKRVLVLFPETKPEGLGIFAERIRRMAREELGLVLNFGVASFPEDALTFEDLQQRAIFNLLDPKKAVYEAVEQKLE